MIHVFITKYALTQGILEKDVEDFGDGVVKGPGSFEYFHGEGKDWHHTRKGAVAKAEAMKMRELTKLNEKINRIRHMKF